MKKNFLIFTTVLSIALLSVSANASLFFFTDRTEWEVATGGQIFTETFNSLSPYYLSEGINDAGLFDIELLNLASISEWNSISDGSAPLTVNGSIFYQAGSSMNGADVINFLLPFETTAFGADFLSTHSAGGLTLRVDGQQYEFDYLLPSGVGDGFLGFISTEGFSTVSFFDTYKNETFGIDNVSIGASAVPEPSTMILLGIGLAGLIGARRKFKK